MANNVAVSGGYAALTVPGGQQADPILSAEIQTAAKDILYGSVRTVAMASTVAGTTHGFSFYSNDTQEADIAFLTDDTAILHLTNEQTGYGQPVTSFGVPSPSDATSAFHEYRMDWVPGKTMFYIDGQLVYQINQNVPSTPGFYLWNNWSNGNAWAKGPPQGTNTVKIQSIVAY
ncbi:concanavalin A-like lectin/glucanase domain-containing protein, partial [Elsinoe ampelina]